MEDKCELQEMQHPIYLTPVYCETGVSETLASRWEADKIIGAI